MDFVIDCIAYFTVGKVKRGRGERRGGEEEKEEEKKRRGREGEGESSINIIINTHLEIASLCHQLNATLVT